MSKEIKLGELLRELNALNPVELADTVRLAMQAGMPLGRALILAGHLTEEELDAALEIQFLLNHSTLTMPTAAEAFAQVKGGLQLPDALERAGWEQAMGVRVHPSRLGSFLVDAKLITKEQLDVAQRGSYMNGLPLGRALTTMGALNQDELARALGLQKLVRSKKISYNQAVLELHSNTIQRSPHYSSQPSTKRAIKLGELLMLAGILTENDIMNALDYGLTSNNPLGDVLIELGSVTKEFLSLALEMQQSIARGDLNVHAATDALTYVSGLKDGTYVPRDINTIVTTAQAATAQSVTKSIRLGELLKLCGFVEEEDIQQAIDLSYKHPALIGKMLVVSGALQEGDLLSALRCQFLLRNGHINVDNAVKALRFAKEQQLSLDDAIDELNIPAARRTRKSIGPPK